MSLPSQLTLVSTSTQMTCHHPHNTHWCLPLHRGHVTTLTTDTGVYLYTEDMPPPSQLTLVSTLYRGHVTTLTTDTGVYLYTEDMSLPSQLTLVSTSSPLQRRHVPTPTTDTGVYFYTEDMSLP